MRLIYPERFTVTKRLFERNGAHGIKTVTIEHGMEVSLGSRRLYFEFLTGKYKKAYMEAPFETLYLQNQAWKTK